MKTAGASDKTEQSEPAPYRRVWALAWPLIISNITVPLVGVADTAVVGHLDDPAYIGGVAIGTMLFNFVFWGFGFLKMGTTGFVAQAYGADDADEIRAVLARALLLACVLGVMVTLLRDPAMLLAFSLLDASAAVEAHAGTYFEIRAWGAVLALANTTLLGWFLGMQDTRSGLVQLLTINLVNVVLNVVLVFGVGMDVDGVAIASVIGQAAGLAVSVWIVRRRLAAVGGRFVQAMILNWSRIRSMMAVNRDIFIRTVCLLLGTALLKAKSAEFGDVTLAANAILLQFLAIAAYGLDGFAHSAEGLVGRAIGQKDPVALSRLVRASTVCAFAVAVLFGAVFWLLGDDLIALMTGIESVRNEAQLYLVWAIFLPILSVWAFQLDGIFIGATRSVEMRNAMILSLLLYVPVLYGAIAVFGNHGLWAAYAVLMGARAVTLWVYYDRVRADAQPAV